MYSHCTSSLAIVCASALVLLLACCDQSQSGAALPWSRATVESSKEKASQIIEQIFMYKNRVGKWPNAIEDIGSEWISVRPDAGDGKWQFLIVNTNEMILQFMDSTSYEKPLCEISVYANGQMGEWKCY